MLGELALEHAFLGAISRLRREDPVSSHETLEQFTSAAMHEVHTIIGSSHYVCLHN